MVSIPGRYGNVRKECRRKIGLLVIYWKCTFVTMYKHAMKQQVACIVKTMEFLLHLSLGGFTFAKVFTVMFPDVATNQVSDIYAATLSNESNALLKNAPFTLQCVSVTEIYDLFRCGIDD